MNYTEFDIEAEYGHLANETDAIREWAWNVGAERPEAAWLCSNYDTWEKNPHYKGEPMPHPEDYDAEAAFFEEGERQGAKPQPAEIPWGDDEIPF